MPINYAEAIRDLCEECAEITESKGFNDVGFDIRSQIFVKTALIGTEVSEAIAVHRDKYEGQIDPIIDMTPEQEDEFTEELADIIIRTFDLAGFLDLDLGNAVVLKMQKNRSRPPKHNKRY